MNDVAISALEVNLNDIDIQREFENHKKVKINGIRNFEDFIGNIFKCFWCDWKR